MATKIFEGKAKLSESEQADYEERAAILEYDAHLSRPEAERQALALILAQRKLRLAS